MSIDRTGIHAARKAVENVVFNVRWLLPLFYAGLIIVLGLYGLTYFNEIKDLILAVVSGEHETMDSMKLIMLDMIDVVMIANLVKMIIAGSYHSFISKAHGYRNEAISSGGLKIKISTSILVVALIQLLKDFVTKTTNDIIFQHLEIFLMFIVGSLALSVIEYLHIKGEVLENESEQRIELKHQKHHKDGKPEGGEHNTPPKHDATVHELHNNEQKEHAHA